MRPRLASSCCLLTLVALSCGDKGSNHSGAGGAAGAGGLDGRSAAGIGGTQTGGARGGLGGSAAAGTGGMPQDTPTGGAGARGDGGASAAGIGGTASGGAGSGGLGGRGAAGTGGAPTGGVSGGRGGTAGGGNGGGVSVAGGASGTPGASSGGSAGGNSSGSGGIPAIGGQTGFGGAAGQGGAVQGSATFSWVNGRGVVDVAVDYSAATIGAFVESPAGTFTYYPGEGTAAGTFTVPGVPLAPFILSVKEKSGASTLLVSSSDTRSFDLGKVQPGRPDLAFSDRSTTGYAFDLTLAMPWDDDYWYMAFDFKSVTTSPYPAPVAAGATKLEIQVGSPYVVLLDGPGKGDLLAIATIGSSPMSDGFTARTVRSALITDTVVATDGVSTPVLGTLTEPSQKRITADWRRSEFEAHRAEVFAPATDWASMLWVGAAPAAAVGAGMFPLAPLEVDGPVGGPDVMLDVAYGDPLPDSWVRSVSASVQTTLVLSPPDGAVRTQHEATITVTDLADRISDHPLRPLVTPALALQVEGRPALQDQTGIGLTPRLTWQPPAIGTATLYRVTVFKVLTMAEASSALNGPTVAELYTVTPSARLPPGILETGRSYYFWVTAIARDGASLSNPFRGVLPAGSADCRSALMRP